MSDDNPTQETTAQEATAINSEDWFTRGEAQDFLKVSGRALQRYAEKKELRVIYRKRPAGGNEALYHKGDLTDIKQKMETPTPRTDKTTALVRASSRALAPIEPTPEPKKKKHDVRVAEKLLLSVAEASALTNIASGELRADIKAGSLKAITKGRGLKIKRSELEAYIRAL